MKKLLLFGLIALLLAACQFFTPGQQPVISPLLPTDTRAAATAVSAVPTATSPVPTETPPPPTPTTPAPIPTQAATPFTEPFVRDRYIYEAADGMGFATAMIGTPGRLWEMTMGGELRVQDTVTMEVLATIPIGDQAWGLQQLTSLAAGERYIWVLILPADPEAASSLYRVSIADFTVQEVELPAFCGEDTCSFSTLLTAGGRLWIGGFGVLWALDPDTLEPVVQCDLVKKLDLWQPYAVLDMVSPQEDALWLLMDKDPHILAALEIPALLEQGDQEPQYIYFTLDTNVDSIMAGGEQVWGAIDSNEYSERLQAQLLLLDEFGVEMGQDRSVKLPAGMEIPLSTSGADVYDGRYLWMLDGGLKNVVAIDPQTGQPAWVVEVYTSDPASADEGEILLGLAFDGQDLWVTGMELFRIALPWKQ